MKQYFVLATLSITAFFHFLEAQSLPPSMRLSDDARMLITGNQAPTGLYDSAIIRNIYLNFSQPDYWNLLTQNYASSTDIPAQMTVDNITYDAVGVRFKGQTSYIGVSNAQKKSFNLSLHAVHEDQRLMGYKTLNLHNAFQDASFLREVFYLHQIRRHIPAAKATFVQLYLNGQHWGLYPHIQQLNKDFLEEWFLSNDGISWRADTPGGFIPGGPGGMWGDGTAALNYLGPDTALYKQYYTLKSSDLENPWNYLTNVCHALNTTTLTELPAVLPNFMDIDRTLWFLATEIAYSDDDSYVFKGKMDYYLYYEPETGRITPIEYDGNSVMKANATNWSPFYNANKVNFPLLNKLLTVPEWRQRYLAHLRTIISEQFNPSIAHAIIDNYKTMIDPLVQADPKKLYSHAQFLNEVNVLKNFITNRRSFLLANPEVAQVAPVIHQAEFRNAAGEAWAAPNPGEAVQVTAQVSSNSGIFRVTLYHAEGLTGNFSKMTMFDDGQHSDGAPGDGIFGATLPAYSAGSWVRFYIEAQANNTARSTSYLPAGAEHDVFVFRVATQYANGPVVINELMASNSSTVTDPFGQYDDWIELYNLSDQNVDLSGYFLSDKANNPTKYRIPNGVSIEPHGYLIFWADENGSQGPTHTNFKLSGDGELVTLYRADTILMDSVEFGPQIADMGYARVPNGTGSFVIQAPTFNSNNVVTKTSEYASPPIALRIFPNPASGEVHFEITEGEGGLSLRVYDMNGRIVHSEVPGENRASIYVSEWPAGVYFVKYGPANSRLVISR